MDWQDIEFRNRTTDVLERVANHECYPKGAADEILDLAYDWLEKTKQDWQNTNQCAE